MHALHVAAAAYAALVCSRSQTDAVLDLQSTLSTNSNMSSTNARKISFSYLLALRHDLHLMLQLPAVLSAHLQRRQRPYWSCHMTREGIAAEIRPAGGGVQRCREISIQVTPCAGAAHKTSLYILLLAGSACCTLACHPRKHYA